MRAKRGERDTGQRDKERSEETGEWSGAGQKGYISEERDVARLCEYRNINEVK